MRTSDLIGTALAYSVGIAEGMDVEVFQYGGVPAVRFEYKIWNPDSNWSQGGPIIEREKIELKENGFGSWFARYKGGKWMRGETPLIAAMRWLVTDRLGNGVEIPEELQNG